MASLESIFRRLTWENRGLKIVGECLSHLRFADDTFICANKPHELQQMLQELADESQYQGLEMNKSKTNVMKEKDTQIENVECYIYLGQRYNTTNQDKEIQRRITAVWTTLAKYRDIFKGNILTCLMRQVCN